MYCLPSFMRFPVEGTANYPLPIASATFGSGCGAVAMHCGGLASGFACHANGFAVLKTRSSAGKKFIHK